MYTSFSEEYILLHPRVQGELWLLSVVTLPSSVWVSMYTASLPSACIQLHTNCMSCFCRHNTDGDVCCWSACSPGREHRQHSQGPLSCQSRDLHHSTSQICPYKAAEPSCCTDMFQPHTGLALGLHTGDHTRRTRACAGIATVSSLARLLV